MNSQQVIILARKHVGNGAVMDSSARQCLGDALCMHELGRLDDAKKRAIDSLRYSVGVFHADYQKAIR